LSHAAARTTAACLTGDRRPARASRAAQAKRPSLSPPPARQVGNADCWYERPWSPRWSGGAGSFVPPAWIQRRVLGWPLVNFSVGHP